MNLKTWSFLFITLMLSVSSAKERRVNTSKGKVGNKPNKELKVPKEWSALLDPKTKEFWREGNHIPDAGFLLFAQNPDSTEYARFWLLRMETKAKVMNKMQQTIDKVQKDMVAEGLMEDRYWQFEDLRKGKISKRLAKNELKKLNFYFLFSSTCSHCKGLSKKLVNFPNLRPLQVDERRILNFNGLLESSRASKETIRMYTPDGIVPVLVIHNPKTNEVTKITGNRPLGEYYLAANSLLKRGL